MTDASASTAALAQENLSAGQILRKVRQAQGMLIADLAASMKVLPRKLELLEADRYDELPDPAFTRALAQAVCRSLKVDPVPVLALLPKPLGMQLEKHQSSLNTPFHERSGKSSRLDPKPRGSGLLVQVWLPALLILSAAVIYLAPIDIHTWGSWQTVLPTETVVADPTPEVTAIAKAALELPSASSAPEPPLEASQAAPPEPVPAPESSPAPTTSESAKAAAAPLLELQVGKDSWIEVKDSSGTQLLARRVAANESVALSGSLPLKLKIGNASHTTVRFRGELVDLLPMTRYNVARLELK